MILAKLERMFRFGSRLVCQVSDGFEWVSHRLLKAARCCCCRRFLGSGGDVNLGLAVVGSRW